MNSESNHPDPASTGLQQAIADRALQRFQRERRPKQFWSAKLAIAILVALAVATVAGLFFDFFLKVLGRYFDTAGSPPVQSHETAPPPDASVPKDAPYMISVDPPVAAPAQKDSGKQN